MKELDEHVITLQPKQQQLKKKQISINSDDENDNNIKINNNNNKNNNNNNKNNNNNNNNNNNKKSITKQDKDDVGDNEEEKQEKKNNAEEYKHEGGSKEEVVVQPKAQHSDYELIKNDEEFEHDGDSKEDMSALIIGEINYDCEMVTQKSRSETLINLHFESYKNTSSQHFKNLEKIEVMGPIVLDYLVSNNKCYIEAMAKLSKDVADHALQSLLINEAEKFKTRKDQYAIKRNILRQVNRWLTRCLEYLIQEFEEGKNLNIFTSLDKDKFEILQDVVSIRLSQNQYSSKFELMDKQNSFIMGENIIPDSFNKNKKIRVALNNNSERSIEINNNALKKITRLSAMSYEAYNKLISS